MSVIDIILLLLFVPAVFHGISKGFIAQAVALLSLLLGAWLSFKFSATVSAWLQPYLDVSPMALHVIAFAIILIGVFLALLLLGKALTGLVKLVMLGWLDKLLGIAFSIIKIGLVVGLVILLFEALNTRYELVPQAILDKSVLYKPIKEVADVVFPYMKELIFKK
jgi:membrane protein required for colicin V production